MNFKLKNAFKFLYFVMQQISLGYISWIMFPFYNSNYTSMFKFFLCLVLIISVMIPNSYINDNILKQNKMFKVIQAAIPIIVFSILYLKFGQPIIRLN